VADMLIGKHASGRAQAAEPPTQLRAGMEVFGKRGFGISLGAAFNSASCFSLEFVLSSFNQKPNGQGKLRNHCRRSDENKK
jgi:hypothetical protein